ncbi:MAG: class I SAM-dependent methyltransferase, partial [Termitinemataceae bacterium]
ETTGIPTSLIFIKERKRLRNRDEGKVQYQRIDTKAEYRIIREGGLQFLVNLSDYLDTGLFLDHRLSRSCIRNEAHGKRVLNLFCYTGSFSVYAAHGGAVQVDSVDLSNTYLSWAAENFTQNRMHAILTDPIQWMQRPIQLGKHFLIRADVLRFLKEAIKTRLRWDLIILDPPTFSNSKKMEGTLDILRDYRDLIGQCLTLLSPQGKLFFSTNARSFHFDNEFFVQNYPNLMIKDMTRATIDEDFKDRKVRQCFLVSLL